MATETCSFCDAVVPFDDAVHVTVHTKAEAGVVDGYICRDCYERELAGGFEESSTAEE